MGANFTREGKLSTGQVCPKLTEIVGKPYTVGFLCFNLESSGIES
jgi:hypothetical protein